MNALQTRRGRGRANHLALAGAAALTLLASGGASAQDALGSGRALDANLQVGSGGYNAPARNFNAEIALRNAIVTGNVGGGKHFRGNVGYSATDDFRGRLGSDDIYSFSRDAAYSGIAAQNIRGIGALQYQLGQSTAGMTRGLGGDLIVRRPGSTLSAGDISGITPSSQVATMDPYGYMRSSLRSTSDFVLRSMAAPNVLLNAEGEYAEPTFVTATPLQGIKTMGVSDSAFGLRTQEDRERLSLVAPAEALREQLGSALNPTGATQTPEETEAEGQPGTAQPVAERVRAIGVHEQLLEGLRERQRAVQPQPVARRLTDDLGEEPLAEEPEWPRNAAPAEPEDSALNSFDRRLEELRKEFREMPELPWQRDERLRKEQRDEERKREQAERLREQLDPNDPLAAANDVRRAPDEDRTEIEKLIRRARETLGDAPTALEQLVAKEGTDDLFTIHMRRGQELLEQEQWFAAEERFAAALRVKPGDPIAAAGRVSAEIGAGMYRSASVNLRTLLQAYPEMIQTRLDRSLFPSGARLERIRAQLRLRSELDTPLARDAGFLLAYVGSQTGNEKDLEEGFTIVDRVDKALGSSPDKLEQVARALWMNRPR